MRCFVVAAVLASCSASAQPFPLNRQVAPSQQPTRPYGADNPPPRLREMAALVQHYERDPKCAGSSFDAVRNAALHEMINNPLDFRAFAVSRRMGRVILLALARAAEAKRCREQAAMTRLEVIDWFGRDNDNPDLVREARMRYDLAR